MMLTSSTIWRCIRGRNIHLCVEETTWHIDPRIFLLRAIPTTSESYTSESDASVSNANNGIKWRGCSSWVMFYILCYFLGRFTIFTIIKALNLDTVWSSRLGG